MANQLAIAGNPVTIQPIVGVAASTQNVTSTFTAIGETIATRANALTQQSTNTAQQLWSTIFSSLPEVNPEVLKSIGSTIVDAAYKPIEYISPYLSSLLDKIATAWGQIINFIRQHMPIDGLGQLTQQIEVLSAELLEGMNSLLKSGIIKSQDIWTNLKPYIRALAEFMKSNLGISFGLLAGGIVCFKMSQNVESRATSIALICIGLAATMAAGVYFMRTGIVPRLPTAPGTFTFASLIPA
jgi:hypothetical protein